MCKFCNLKQGLGITTCNVAEYNALILGLRAASDRGVQHIRVQGDSKLVCKQMKGAWKVRNSDLVELWKEAKELCKRFKTLSFHHVARIHNSAADALANAALQFAETQILGFPTTSVNVELKTREPKPIPLLRHTECGRDISLIAKRGSSVEAEGLGNTEIEVAEFQQSSVEEKPNVANSMKRNIALPAIYQLEFDGACKGEPSRAGAGALIRYPDGSVHCELKEGLGPATFGVPEYRALITGLQAALDSGILHIRVQGNSKLVCKQITGVWKVRSKNLANLFANAMDLAKRFEEFSVHHVSKKLNTAASALAIAAVTLPETKRVCSATSIPWSVEINEEQCNEQAPESDGNFKVAAESCNQVRISEPAFELHERRSVSSVCHTEQCTDECPTMEASSFTMDNKVVNLYQLEYNAVNSRNSGKTGIGALLRCPDGSVHLEIKKGLEASTMNVAYYRALIAGLQAALDAGVCHIRVQGSSNLIVNQMVGKCKVRNRNLTILWKEADELRKRFEDFSIRCVDKKSNAAASVLANDAIQLPGAMIKFSTCMTSKGRFSRKQGSALTGGRSGDIIQSKRFERLFNTSSTVASLSQPWQNRFQHRMPCGSSYSKQACELKRLATPKAVGIPFHKIVAKSLDRPWFASTKCTGFAVAAVSLFSFSLVC